MRVEIAPDVSSPLDKSASHVPRFPASTRAPFVISFIISTLCLLFPITVSSYSQPYYEPYYEPYYQPYYQSSYYSQSYYQTVYYSQSSYQTTITVPSIVTKGFTVTNTVSKAAGSFVIDHPLDPANKLLYHSFVESPDAKNVYDGIAVLDERGEAVVELPSYFDALNKDVRYQLKPIGFPMPNLHVKSEERDNKFAIAGGAPRGRVSWQITGVRRDPYILAHPIIPEVEKGPGQPVQKGEYLFPEGYSTTVFPGLFSMFAEFLGKLFYR